MTDTITIPADLLPADGRFGAGPSKVRLDAPSGARRDRYVAARHVTTARPR